MPKILQPDANYTFRSFFELPNDPDEILAEFDYGYTQARLALPVTTKSLPGLEDLKVQIEATIKLATKKGDKLGGSLGKRGDNAIA